MQTYIQSIPRFFFSSSSSSSSLFSFLKCTHIHILLNLYVLSLPCQTPFRMKVTGVEEAKKTAFLHSKKIHLPIYFRFRSTVESRKVFI